MILNNKFEIGQELYTVIRKPIDYDCPICKAEGKFNHNGYDVKCPKCQGVGKLTDSKILWSVDENKVTVRSLRANIHENTQSIRYNVNSMTFNIHKRPEHQLFVTKEEAEQFCYDNNNAIVA